MNATATDTSKFLCCCLHVVLYGMQSSRAKPFIPAASRKWSRCPSTQTVYRSSPTHSPHPKPLRLRSIWILGLSGTQAMWKGGGCTAARGSASRCPQSWGEGGGALAGWCLVSFQKLGLEPRSFGPSRF